jgi:hypothetical protein
MIATTSPIRTRDKDEVTNGDLLLKFTNLASMEITPKNLNKDNIFEKGTIYLIGDIHS